MKKTILLTLMGLFFLNQTAMATGDWQTEVLIVVESFNGDGDYMLQKAPAVMCVGIPAMSLALAITQPVKIKTNYGCGGQVFDEQVNQAVCAKIEAEEVWKDESLTNNVNIDLDVTACGEKSQNYSFLETLKSAIYKSYNKSGIQIQNLNIKK